MTTDTVPTARIGVLGGTFDPPHHGHLVAADQVRVDAGLDEVWLVPAGDPWQKQGTRTITRAEERLELVRLAVADVPGLAVCDIEVRREGPSYSVETLSELRERHPGVEFVLIVGADAAAGLDTWHRADELRRTASIIVVDRPGAVGRVPDGWSHRRVDIPDLEISSTDLRRRFRDGRSVRFLLPDAVITRCEQARLYAP